MSEFGITPMYGKGFELTLRCQVWQILPESGDELTEDDSAFWKRIETVLNENAERIIQDPAYQHERDERPGVLYWQDSDNRLWKGPIPNDETLHWARFEGWMESLPAKSIWVLRTSDKPSDVTEVTFEEFCELAEEQ